MRTRTVFVVIAVCLCSMVQAQPRFVEGTRGSGAAASSAGGPDARFLFSAARFVDGGTEFVRGTLDFASRMNGRAIAIEGAVGKLTVDGATMSAEFAGRGVAVIRTDAGFRRVRGAFTVRVQDRHPATRDPDTIALAFMGENGFQFNYRGLVTDGDIVVAPK